MEKKVKQLNEVKLSQIGSHDLFDLARENPYVNCKMLQREINIWREKNGIVDRFSEETMKQYKKILTDLKNKQ